MKRENYFEINKYDKNNPDNVIDNLQDISADFLKYLLSIENRPISTRELKKEIMSDFESYFGHSLNDLEIYARSKPRKNETIHLQKIQNIVSNEFKESDGDIRYSNKYKLLMKEIDGKLHFIQYINDTDAPNLISKIDDDSLIRNSSFKVEKPRLKNDDEVKYAEKGIFAKQQMRSNLEFNKFTSGNKVHCAIHNTDEKMRLYSFVKRDGELYFEKHHIIPLSCKIYSKIMLDDVWNIVPLCSNCHKTVHYGDESEVMKVLNWIESWYNEMHDVELLSRINAVRQIINLREFIDSTEMFDHLFEISKK